MDITVINNTGEAIDDFGYFLLDKVQDLLWDELDSNRNYLEAYNSILDFSKIVDYVNYPRAIDIISVYRQAIEDLEFKITPKTDLVISINNKTKVFGTYTSVYTFIKFFEYGNRILKITPHRIFLKVFENVEKDIYNYYREYLLEVGELI